MVGIVCYFFRLEIETGLSSGYNLMKLYLERSPFDNVAASSRLLAAFKAAHGPTDTEVSFVHPYDDWTRLATSVYKPPLVTTPTLAGIFWVNFFGPGHLTDFDVETLHSRLTENGVEWVDDQGLYVFTSPNVADADSSTVHTQMLELTDTFRRASKAT